MNLDEDPQETMEWCDSLHSVAHHAGPGRARHILEALVEHAMEMSLDWNPNSGTRYVNSIPVEAQARFPGNRHIEERLVSIMRWNALAMVVRANSAYGELGGHIASYASAADLFEVGFNHFFKARHDGHGGDLVFFQPHSAPGIYARAFLEGRLGRKDLEHFRQEIMAGRAGCRGLPSYPHPWLMPDFWQFPTGSMGIGPINSIYQARFMRYLQHRELLDISGRTVWGVFGDGEMDEPESISALTLAARERLDNLVWVVNCNLQRLDGPVRSNGRIIDELETLFKGAGWNVIKVVWGSDWDPLFSRDSDHALTDALSRLVDGELQTLAAKDGRYNREQFFGQNDTLRALVCDLSDEQIDGLKRGGHDLEKIYAAYAAASAFEGGPSVVLTQTKKGFGMGEAGQGRMTTHQQKKLDDEALLSFRDRFELPLNDEETLSLAFYRPDDGSEEMRYLRERRENLGGPIPARRSRVAAVPVPPVEAFAEFAIRPNDRSMSTTMAFVRMLAALCRSDDLGERIVPIVADEARTFGMASMFRSLGIYSSAGQEYEPEDIGSILSYREARDGQILEEGICEAGAISSWTAAATSYSTHGLAMLPFYIFYSIFGFQRVGDLIWAAADQRARGFLVGATSGRTTLGGEGLQHQDGSSHLAAATIPNCRAYDPAFAGELAIILNHGMTAMLEAQRDEFYYVTVMNEKYPQPDMPAGCEAEIIKGLYLFREQRVQHPDAEIRLLGSGAIMPEVIEAATLLATEWNIDTQVFSVTSYPELAREAMATERWNRLHPGSPPMRSHVETLLGGITPVVAVSDYVRALPQLIASYVEPRMLVLGTDGFGRSDTRAALRDFFEVDRHHIVVAALFALAREGRVTGDLCDTAIRRYGLDTGSDAPWSR